MNNEPILVALALLAFLLLWVGFAALRKGIQPLVEFFLANRSVRSSLIISLLVSGSFSLNGMLYQVYLGYKIGFLAIVTQIAWAASFYFLAHFKKSLIASSGLHNMLGVVFSPVTRKIAAVCSIIGLGLQIAWEYGVAKSAFAGLVTPTTPTLSIGLIVFTIFAIATCYTLLGGLRSNSWADLFENVLKGGCFAVLLVLIIGIGRSWHLDIRPHFTAAIAELTIVGLIANVAFSLVWQFVDMTTWQTIVASKADDSIITIGRSIRRAGIWVLIAPGVLGTLIGMSLAGPNSLDSNSVLPALIHAVGGGPIIVFILTIAVAATVMSFIDGMLLGAGFTLITDLLFSKAVDRYQLLKAPNPIQLIDPAYQRMVGSIQGWTRVALVVTVILFTYGSTRIAEAMHISLFDYVYFVIVAQLSLFGPSLVGLLGRQPRHTLIGPFAILLPLLLGYGLATFGTFRADPNLVNGASIATLLLSFAIAFFGTAKPSSIVEIEPAPGS